MATSPIVPAGTPMSGTYGNYSQAGRGYTETTKDSIKFSLQANISSSFAGTLGQVDDIVRLCLSLMFRESGLDPDGRHGDTVSSNRGTAGYKYLTSSAVLNILNTGNPAQRANIMQGLNAWGLGQVMGWNFVRGGGPAGKCQIEISRPDLAGALCVNPGESIQDKAWGSNNISTMVLASLVILESKYKNVVLTPKGYMSKGDPYNRVFPSKIEASIAAYLGLGTSDRNGTTPQAYAASICYGNAYVSANGNSLVIRQSKSQTPGSGPSTNGSDQKAVVPAGC